MDTEIIAINLEFQLLDKDGNPDGGPISVPSGSWTQQFAWFMYVHFSNLNSPTNVVKDTGGTDRTLSRPNNHGIFGNLKAAIADDTFGIVAGTSTQALDKDDNALITKIAEGAGAGQFNYQVCAVSTVTAITGGYRLAVTRTINNNSGGSITIEEVGIIGKVTSTPFFFLFIRDLATLVVADTVSAVITYNIDFLV